MNQPPLALILEDPEHTWTFWDYRLVTALTLYEDLQSGTGVPLYIDRSDRVRFEVGSYVSRSKAALDRAEDKAREGKTKNYGKVFYPIPITLDGGPLPTMEEFLQEQEAKRQMTVGKIRVGGQFDNSDWEPKDQQELLS